MKIIKLILKKLILKTERIEKGKAESPKRLQKRGSQRRTDPPFSLYGDRLSCSLCVPPSRSASPPLPLTNALNRMLTIAHLFPSPLLLCSTSRVRVFPFDPLP